MSEQDPGQEPELDQAEASLDSPLGVASSQSGGEPDHTSGEDSPDRLENQGEQSVMGATPSDPEAEPASEKGAEKAPEIDEVKALADRMSTKLNTIEDLLANREGLMQQGAVDKINKAYRVRWQEEANEFFQLAVMLRSRMRRIAEPSGRKRDRIA